MIEHRLSELLDDPLVGLVMKSDGVDRRKLERLLEEVARGRFHDGTRAHRTDN
jgi:hypothetical protein